MKYMILIDYIKDKESYSITTDSHLEKNPVSTVRTRFPPEPNGPLHIGHLKAMVMNFDYAAKYGGECILRLDDTNPDTEKQSYVDGIIRDVDWLGFKYVKITYTSDYFNKIYEQAKILILAGLAYVDDSSREQMCQLRRQGLKSPCRDRAIHESLTIFEDMKDGLYKDGQYVLRLRIQDDVAKRNSSMDDPVAYTIKHPDKRPHYRTTGWCIYPSYDFSHPIVDSFENVTHSYCTREFFIRRELYYWVLHALDLPKPFVHEFDRLNIRGAILSKRKIMALIDSTDNEIMNFDHPSLFTISGLRSHGHAAEALIHFCRNYVDYTENDTSSVELHKFEHAIKEYYSQHLIRRFGIKDPLKLVITNFSKISGTINRPDNPDVINSPYRIIPSDPIVYIDRSDFMMNPPKKYKRFSPTRRVWLRYYGLIEYQLTDEDGTIHVCMDQNPSPDISKGCSAIQWVSGQDMVKYPTSLSDVPNMWCEKNIKAGDRVQLERIGYYYCDSFEHLVEIIPLKQWVNKD